MVCPIKMESYLFLLAELNSQMDHNPNYHNPYSTYFGNSTSGEPSTSGQDHSFVVHPTIYAPPSDVAHPVFVNPSLGPYVVIPHRGIYYHAGPYPELIRPYNPDIPEIGLKFTDIYSPFGYYQMKKGGVNVPDDLIMVLTNERQRALISMPDCYALGILNYKHMYFGLYAEYYGNYVRVTIPPGDIGAELMIPYEEINVFPNFRKFVVNTKTPAQKRRKM